MMNVDYQIKDTVLHIITMFSFVGEQTTEYAVCFLPPLVLNFELPADYPSLSAPVFTLSSKWMTKAQVELIFINFVHFLKKKKKKILKTNSD